MARRKKIVVPVEVGDIFVIRDWSGANVHVRANKLTESKEHGPVVEGTVVELVEGYWRHQYYTALPLSRKVETARVRSEGRGKWIIDMPDGTTEKAKSKKAAIELCEQRGVVIAQEVVY